MAGIVVNQWSKCIYRSPTLTPTHAFIEFSYCPSVDLFQQLLLLLLLQSLAPRAELEPSDSVYGAVFCGRCGFALCPRGLVKIFTTGLLSRTVLQPQNQNSHICRTAVARQTSRFMLPDQMGQREDSGLLFSSALVLQCNLLSYKMGFIRVLKENGRVFQ